MQKWGPEGWGLEGWRLEGAILAQAILLKLLLACAEEELFEMCLLSQSGSLLFVRTVLTQHGSQVEVSGRIVWMGPDHPGQHPQPSHAPQGKTSGIRPFQGPSVKVAAAEERVAKFEGPEEEMVRAAHQRALEAIQGVPINVQVKECESFLVRARSHLAELDSKRATSELRAKLHTPPPSEEYQLRGWVSQLQAQVASLRGPSLDIQSPNPMRPRRREDFLPHCDEEMQEWMECRHQDLQAAVAAGQIPEVVRISQILTQAAQEWQQLIQGQSTSAFPSAVANKVTNPLK